MRRYAPLLALGITIVMLAGISYLVWAQSVNNQDFAWTYKVHDPYDMEDYEWEWIDVPCDYATSANAAGVLSGVEWQTGIKLVPDSDWAVGGIELYVYKDPDFAFPDPAAPLSVTVRSGAGPITGTILTTGTYGPEGIQHGDWTEPVYYRPILPVQITFSQAVTLTSGQTYWIWFVSLDSTNNAFYDLPLSTENPAQCPTSRPGWLPNFAYSYNVATESLAEDTNWSIPFALNSGTPPTPTPTPTATATATPAATSTPTVTPTVTPILPGSTPGLTPTPWKQVQVYAAEEATPVKRPAIIVHYNP